MVMERRDGERAKRQAQRERAAASSGATIAPPHPGSPLLRVHFVSREEKTADDAVTALAPIREQISHLDLARTAICDATVRTLAGFPHLVNLDLSRTAISDREFVHLKHHAHLRVLNLHGTQIRDDAVTGLASLERLRSLYRWGTGLSANAIERLRKALPEARVVATVDLPRPSKNQPAHRAECR